MANQLIPHQIQYDIQRLITASRKEYHERTPSERTLVNSEDLLAPLKEIAKQAFGEQKLYALPINSIIYGDAHEIIKSLLQYPELFQKALDIYQRDRAEEVYPTLLDKPISEMTGYQYSVLMSRILVDNTTKTPVKLEE